MSQNPFARFSLVMVALCGCLFAHGQEEEIYGSDTVETLLDEVIVSANRWEQNLREVAGKVSTIRSATVELQNPQTAADLLQVSNAVFVQKSQLGGGSPMIRGFATNRVLLVVDGVRMNNAIFRSGNVQNVISLDANAIREAEVVFGPGSVIYGSDAIGGVMDFHTLMPALQATDERVLSGNVLARYSSANRENTVHLDLNAGGKRWAFLSSVTRSDYGDLRMGSNGPDEYTLPQYAVTEGGADAVRLNADPELQLNTGYEQWNTLQKIRFKPDDVKDLIYSFHYSRTSDYGRYDRLILMEGDVPANAEWYYGPQKWMMHSLTFEYNRGVSFLDHARVTGAFQDYTESRHNRSFGSTRRTDRIENVKALSFNLDVDKALGANVSLFYGAEFVSNAVGSTASRQDVLTGAITPTSTRYPDGARWRSAAAYISLKIKPSDKWLLHLSNRFTRVYTRASFDRTFFDFQFTEAELKNKSLNGSLGLIFSPKPTAKVYANVSSGFRAPNVDDIGKVFDSEPGNVVVPNPGLEPERAYNAEIGFAAYAGRFRFDFAAYSTSIDNAIARGPATFNGQDSIDYDGTLSRVLSLQNISAISVGGLQAGVQWQAGEHIEVSTTLNYQRGKERDPQTGREFSPTHVAPMFGATHVMYTNRKLKANLYANYNGAIRYDRLALSERGDHHLYAKDALGNPYAPSWWTLNVKLQYLFLSRLSASAGVENILDKRYRPYSSGIAAPGRNVIVALRARF